MSAITLAILSVTLAVHTCTDLREGYVYDAAVYPPLAALTLLAWLAGHLTQAAEGALLCAALPAALTAATRGRGMGIGDAKVATLIGTALGPAAGAQALGCAFVWGAAVSLALVAARRLPWGAPVAFVPYLALGCLSVVLVERSGLR